MSIDKIYSSIYEHYGELSDKQKLQIRLLTLDYVFRFIPTLKFSVGVQNILGKGTENVTLLKNDILSSSYIMRNFKIYVIQFFSKKKTDKLGIHKEDIESLKSVAKYKRKQIKKWAETSPTTMQELDDLYLTCWNSSKVNTHTRKFIYRKMRFITSNSMITKEDIESYLKTEMLQSLLFGFHSLESEDHAINFAKQIIRNVGQNYIKSVTTQKSAFMFNTGENGSEHLLKVLSINHQDFDVDSLSYAQDNLVVISLMKLRERLRPKYHKMYDLVLGIYDEDFSKYLAKKRLCTLGNDVWANKTNLNAKMIVIFKYCNLNPDKIPKYQKRLVKAFSSIAA